MNKDKNLTQILKTHFKKDMNLAKIRCMAFLIMALYKVQSVNLAKLANAFESGANKDSSLRRIQRFLAKTTIHPDWLAKFIFSLLPTSPPYYLLLDRTNWKSCKKDINILMLSIAYKKVSFPILFSLLPLGASSTQARIDLIKRYINLFDKASIALLIADREFRGEAWLNFLSAEKIPYLIRIKDGSASISYVNGEHKPVKELFRDLTINQAKSFPKPFIINGNPCYLSGLCFVNDKGKRDLVALISLNRELNPFELYSQRWQIETMFKTFKSSGFHIEETHVTQPERFAQLLSVVMIAFSWAYLVGIFERKHLPKIRILSHGRQAMTLFKYGLEFLAQALLNPCKFANFYVALKFLSST